MRAINLPYHKAKLRDVSRSLQLERDWDIPRGLQDRRLRDPLNFTPNEWQPGSLRITLASSFAGELVAVTPSVRLARRSHPWLGTPLPV